jgi:hypothetical protein
MMKSEAKTKSLKSVFMAGAVATTAVAGVLVAPQAASANTVFSCNKINLTDPAGHGPARCRYSDSPGNNRTFSAVDGVIEIYNGGSVCGVWKFHLQRSGGANTDVVQKARACWNGNGSYHTAYKKNWTADGNVEKIWMQFVPDGGSDAYNPYIAIDLCC